MRGARFALSLCLFALLGAEPANAVPPPPLAASPVSQLIARGDAALRGGDSISAIAFYRDAVSRAPRDPRGYAALGRAYLEVREPERAREALESGVRHTNGSEALSLGLAETYERLGRLAQAIETLRALLSEAEDVLSVQETLARLCERSGAFTEALAVRRAKLARLRDEGETAAAARAQEQMRVSALSLLLGGADRLGRQHCAQRKKSPILSALLGCR